MYALFWEALPPGMGPVWHSSGLLVCCWAVCLVPELAAGCWARAADIPEQSVVFSDQFIIHTYNGSQRGQ